LILRDFRESDWQAVHEYASDLDTVRFMPFGPNTEQNTKEFIKIVLAQQKEQPRVSYNFALVVKSGNQLVGSCRIRAAAENKEGDIGYVLNRNYWNRDYMTEAARRVVSFGFERLGMHRIFATCDPANIGSYRVMEKTGMKREGHLREHKLMKGRWRDSLIYSILEPEWRVN
jgi:[ribosomal protein S5]-alanine N-acetyltransferase